MIFKSTLYRARGSLCPARETAGVQVATRDYDALFPAAFLARRVGVSRQLFNYWVRSDKIAPRGRDPLTGHPTYRYGDAIELEAVMRNSPRCNKGRREVRIATERARQILAA